MDVRECDPWRDLFRELDRWHRSQSCLHAHNRCSRQLTELLHTAADSQFDSIFSSVRRSVLPSQPLCQFVTCLAQFLQSVTEIVGNEGFIGDWSVETLGRQTR